MGDGRRRFAGPTVTVFSEWRTSLQSLLDRFGALRDRTPLFYPKAFAVFAAISFCCYWVALLGIYPELLSSDESLEHTIMSVPVSLIGAIFDTASLLITLFVIRRALRTDSDFAFTAYLSLGLILPVCAAVWILFAFVLGGWIVNLILSLPESFEARTILYHDRVLGLLHNPFDIHNQKNFYFGVVMSFSALLPVVLHVIMGLRSAIRSWSRG
jgi:hypothetical protein